MNRKITEPSAQNYTSFCLIGPGLDELASPNPPNISGAMYTTFMLAIPGPRVGRVSKYKHNLGLHRSYIGSDHGKMHGPSPNPQKFGEGG